VKGNFEQRVFHHAEKEDMKTMKHDISLRIVKYLNVILVTIPFALCWYGYYADRIVIPFYDKGNWLIIAIFMVLYIVFARVYDAFLVSLNRISEMVYSQILSVLMADAMMYVILWLLMRRFPNILPALAALALQIVLVVMWCVLAHKWYYAVFPPQKSMIVYDTREGLEKLIRQYGLEKKFDVQQVIQVEECLDELWVLDSTEAVFLSGIHSHERNIILKYCVEHNVRVYVIPRIGDVIMSGAKQMHMFHLPVLRVGRYSPLPEYLFFKRAFDIAAAGIAVVILSPVMLVTAIAIKAYDGGPVLYKQTRLTKDGRQFLVWKFRSMSVNAEQDGVARLSTGANDARVTPVGRVIRKVRVDELPQLFNVLGGSMSIVGPRPERPEIAAQYEEEMPEFRLRLQAKAGLTGYAQVYSKYNTTPYDKLQMDLMYISHPSFLEDLRICFVTVRTLFSGEESTEGIAEGQVTAMKRAPQEDCGTEQEIDQIVMENGTLTGVGR